MRDLQFKDIKSVKDLFTNYTLPRITKMLGWRESRELAKELLNKTFRSRTQSLKAIHDWYAAGAVEEPPPQCECPPASGTRWHTMPVTWSYNPKDEDIPNSSVMIRELFVEIAQVCNIQFEENALSRANIHISNRRLDGRGRTLGITYVPAQGDRMSACGPQCGDIIIDKDEVWTPGYLRTVMLHELLHALGLPHTNDRRSVMFPSYLGVRGMHQVDIDELKRRYPETAPA